MSKRWVTVAGALLLLCAAPPAALAANPSMVTLAAGSQTPTGDFGEIASTGAMVGLSAGYRVTRWLEAGMDLGYFRSKGARDGWVFEVVEPGDEDLVEVTTSENWTVTELGLYGKAFVLERGRLGPYLRAGIGTYTVRYNQDVSVSSASTTVGGTEQQSKFGVSAGLGAHYRVLGGTSIGLEALYHRVFVKDADVSFWTTGLTVGFGPGAEPRSDQ